jgi:hypothetical protein
LCVVCLSLLSCAVAHAQTNEANPWFVRVGFASGYVLSPNPFTAIANNPNDVIHWTPNLTIEAGWQTDGRERWHEIYGLPSVGFGLSWVSFRNGGIASRPTEASVFFSWPFAPLTDRLALTTDFGMGLSWGWTALNTNSRVIETVLGSNVNARIDWGFYLRYRATQKIATYMGVDFTHRSNGGMLQPDIGINQIGPKVAVAYALGSQTVPRRRKNRAPFRPVWEFVVGGTGGIKNVVERPSPMTRTDFGTINVTTAIQRQFYRFGKIVAGTDVTYDGSTGARVDGDNKPWRAAMGERWSVGVYGGYEQIVGRFGPFVQAGDDVARSSAAAGVRRLYSRFGWRYHANDRLWTTFAIRVYGFRNANALEIGAGYRFGGPAMVQ